MATTLVVGLDGTGSGARALAFAKRSAKLIGECKLYLVYVVEWSPYSFQTAEENAKRHKEREAEISLAMERIITPAVAELEKEGLEASGAVKHGDVADTLNNVAIEQKAEQIIVARASEGGFVKRLFGTSTGNLVMSASVPVTVVA